MGRLPPYAKSCHIGERLLGGWNGGLRDSPSPASGAWPTTLLSSRCLVWLDFPDGGSTARPVIKLMESNWLSEPQKSAACCFSPAGPSPSKASSPCLPVPRPGCRSQTHTHTHTHPQAKHHIMNITAKPTRAGLYPSSNHWTHEWIAHAHTTTTSSSTKTKQSSTVSLRLVSEITNSLACANLFTRRILMKKHFCKFYSMMSQQPCGTTLSTTTQITTWLTASLRSLRLVLLITGT